MKRSWSTRAIGPAALLAVAGCVLVNTGPGNAFPNGATGTAGAGAVGTNGSGTVGASSGSSGGATTSGTTSGWTLTCHPGAECPTPIDCATACGLYCGSAGVCCVQDGDFCTQDSDCCAEDDTFCQSGLCERAYPRSPCSAAAECNLGLSTPDFACQDGGCCYLSGTGGFCTQDTDCCGGDCAFVTADYGNCVQPLGSSCTVTDGGAQCADGYTCADNRCCVGLGSFGCVSNGDCCAGGCEASACCLPVGSLGCSAAADCCASGTTAGDCVDGGCV